MSLPTSDSKSKGSKREAPPWFKCFPRDYLEGTRKLTPEQRGLYFDCLCLIYQNDGPIQDDDQWIAHQLHVHLRTWKAVKKVLIDAGKLTSEDGLITNMRASKEVQDRLITRSEMSHAAVRREAEKRQKSKKANIINDGGPPPCHDGTTTRAGASGRETSEFRSTEVEIAAATLESTAPREAPAMAAAAAGPPVDLIELRRRVVEAAGDSIASEAAAPGLVHIGVVSGWIDQGCDLDRDILPAIREVAARPRQRPIQSWTYFGRRVGELRDERTSPIARTAGPVGRHPPRTPEFAWFHDMLATGKVPDAKINWDAYAEMAATGVRAGA